MSKLLSVQIVGFSVVGENAVEMVYKFQGSTKRIKRIMGLTEAMRKENRVGKYLQIAVSDEEVLRIFGKKEDKPVIEPVVEYDLH